MALFRIPHIAILARFQRILRLFRDYSKYRGFIAVIGKIAILLRFYKISRYRDDRDKVTSLLNTEISKYEEDYFSPTVNANDKREIIYTV